MRRNNFLIVLGLAGVITSFNAFYTVGESQQVILTQFGKPVGEPVTEAGLKMKVPFIQSVNVIDKRVLEWDGPAADMPTKDKLYVTIDMYARWQIKDPMAYFLRLRDERSAMSRLDDILGGETRNAVAKNALIEIVRTTKGETPAKGADADGGVPLPPISKGRVQVEQEIFADAKVKLASFGIELLDIRFKRINYNLGVEQKIHERMISERLQIAEKFRSEGHGEAARIRGNMTRDLSRIESEAYRRVEEIRGEGDAKATEIYASAYNQGPEATRFYEFTRSMDAYKAIISPDSTLVLSTDSDLFKFLKGIAK